MPQGAGGMGAVANRSEDGEIATVLGSLPGFSYQLGTCQVGVLGISERSP
jgi:hypothetical protein